MPRRWALGTGLGEVDLRSREVDLKNLTYQVDLESVWLRFERQLFTAQMERQVGLLTYQEYLAQKEAAE